jgi:hypothetical protein
VAGRALSGGCELRRSVLNDLYLGFDFRLGQQLALGGNAIRLRPPAQAGPRSRPVTMMDRAS